MPATLSSDLQQTKPFTSLAHECFLNVLRTSNTLTDAMEDLFKGYGITGTQYNVLRILRGAAPDGICRNALRDRMLSRMPDMTRLLDRMEEAGLVVRTRGSEDRRLVSTKITDRALQLLAELDKPVGELHEAQLGHLTEEQLRSLIDLLTQARNTG